ncbi:MAG: membrane protein insertion efficiency factor YidD [Clostridia bacterium]|nr:membrane protein insertion efficiency factor YidD [Clostridia bacterium]MDD4375308.1 membrane protein insertion efficiency factor YidD [Clostridia bacterium]
MKKINYLLKSLIIWSINKYKVIVSPFTKRSCKYYPTCSNYAILAIDKHGIIKGSIKAIWRIIRCNPFSKRRSRFVRIRLRSYK